jgi:hypothetical protein
MLPPAITPLRASPPPFLPKKRTSSAINEAVSPPSAHRRSDPVISPSSRGPPRRSQSQDVDDPPIKAVKKAKLGVDERAIVLLREEMEDKVGLHKLGLLGRFPSEVIDLSVRSHTHELLGRVYA